MSSFHASAKVLNFIDTRPKDNEVKGAVQLDANIQRFLNAGRNSGKNVRSLYFQSSLDKSVPHSTFAIFDKQDDNLMDFINRLSNQLGQPQLSDDKDGFGAYGLMFDDGRRFVTEQNKHLIQQGFLLILTASPANYARSFLAALANVDMSRDVSAALSALTLFSGLAADTAFANALKAVGGVAQIISLIENGVFEANVTILCQLLQFFLVLMGHTGAVCYDDFTSRFVEKIAVYVNGSSKIENNDSLYLSLSIILNVMNQCAQLRGAVKEEVKFETLIRHLVNSDERILLSALTLMTSIYSFSTNEEKQAIVKILHSKPFVDAIEAGIVRESLAPDQRIRVQLVQIQEILLEELRNLALRLPTEQEIEYIMAMEEWNLRQSFLNFGGILLRRESSSLVNTSGSGTDLETEFPAQIDEAQIDAQRGADASAFRRIVQNAPPGLLAIDAILDFSRPKNCPNSRLKEIQSESLLRVSVWPVVMASLAKSLIFALGICGDRTNSQNDFSQLILKSERPFYDIFAIIVELFHRTWHEMHANVCDLEKVLSVVQDQIERVLTMNPASLEELDHVVQKKFSYFHMQKIWERERIEQEELELNSVEVQSLRNYLRSGIEELVMERKKSFLKNGLVFTKFSIGKTHGKDSQQPQQQQQYWFWKLDNNERFFYYTDCKLPANQRQAELDLTTSKKLSIFNIQRIVYGPEYSNQISQQFGVKVTKKSQPNSLLRCGLCIELKNGGGGGGSGSEDSGLTGDQIHLTTNSETDLNAWIDGMNCLITPQVALQSPAICAEVERLLNLEVRVRLLDIRNLPTEKPPTPPPPPTDLSWIPKQIS